MKSKKLYIPIITIILILLFNISIVFADSTTSPAISSEAAFLIDNNTNLVLYNKNENQKMYPASTTKIMTAILSLENCKLDDVVTVSYDAAMSIPQGYSTAYLQVGEQLTVEQLLELLLVHSANDAANVLAEHVGGSIDSFVSMMNTKVDELDLTDTHFTNAYGKHDENHYTTAHDLAKIMQYCIENEDFRKIAGSASCAIPATNAYNTRSYTSTNEMLIPNNKYYYQYLTAGKTGYTSEAKDCLVSCAYQNDLELICVILGGTTTSNGLSARFAESKLLYEYGYNNYSIKNIINFGDVLTQIEVKNATQDTKKLDLMANHSISALINNSDVNTSFEPQITLNEDIVAPIEQDAILGSVKYTVNGIEYTSQLIATHSVAESKLLSYSLQIGFLIILLFTFYRLLFSKRKKYSRKR